MSSTIDLSGLDRLVERFRKIANPDPKPLMLALSIIVERDNREGVLAGIDCRGNPMTPVTYRPKPAALKLTAAQKNNPKKGSRRGEFHGIGQHPAGINNNLTSAEYRRLAGPPMAPRGPFSRVITNLRFLFGEPVPGAQWELIGYWEEVVNTKSQRFLHYHFTGGVHLPQRDLAGVRPNGVLRARNAARAWMIDQVRSA
jgi:hypothetical protein